MDTHAAIDRIRGAVAARGGVARVSSLEREGHTRHFVAAAVERQALARVRRDWIALPDADADLVGAARAGVVLSCITQARRLGLWVEAERRLHVAADPRAAGGKPRHVRVHWAAPVVPRHPDQLTDTIENTLIVVAACQSHEVALAIWESAMNRRLISRPELERLPLPVRARRLLEESTPFHDSGLETIFEVRLRWLRVRIIPQAWIAGHRVDFLIGRRLVVQVDGGHHVGVQRASDVRHDAELSLLGYVVIRVGYRQIMDDWPAVQDLIARAVAQGLHEQGRW
jgi:very-short-patch-repair endonuclease